MKQVVSVIVAAVLVGTTGAALAKTKDEKFAERIADPKVQLRFTNTYNRLTKDLDKRADLLAQLIECDTAGKFIPVDLGESYDELREKLATREEVDSFDAIPDRYKTREGYDKLFAESSEALDNSSNIRRKLIACRRAAQKAAVND